ncbi:arylsulfatase [Streptomyces inhibens]|uniref:Arylsulfatase n=1 Tax=Streptomyces inhibens TaxID=2293571 RepID=A0A371PWQ1_STRIH|nr:aspartate/glutamate racemase family protein [Streptomyces inhibens]REK86899.1 arylsulfatase [Streptomyces inhibens]
MLALLHTSSAHVPVFDALRDEDAPGLALHHLVRPELLSRARTQGPDAVAEDVSDELAAAARDGARVVLCTCSTIGSVAETAGAALGLPVLRVDRPMAAAAVAAGPRIAVLATVESTFAPTESLLAEEADRAGREISVRRVLVQGAWEKFETGDTDAYLATVATAARAVADTDVIVLAQASMAPAANDLALGVPVLSSPRPGLRAAAQLAASDPNFSGLRTM